MLITSLPLLLVLLIICVIDAVWFFRSVDKDAKEEQTYYESLSEDEKKEYDMMRNKEQMSKQASAAANHISGNRNFM